MFLIKQTDPIAWTLLHRASANECWVFVNSYGSEADAIAGMNAQIARGAWVAPAAKIYDASGVLTIQVTPA